VYLNLEGLRSGSGTRYTMITNGTDVGGTASTAAWDWTGGVLTMTSGTLYSAQRIGSGPAGDLILRDVTTGLAIDTGAGTTTATSYDCIEGTFGAGTGAHTCGNILLNGAVPGYESTLTYNVGGDADCINRTIGGNDAAAGPVRGLTNHASDTPDIDCADQSGRGAKDMIYVVENTLGTGGQLILANWNGTMAVPIGTCINSVSKVAACGNNPHWFVFRLTDNAVPVPAAVWLFGSALGLLGWVRRRAMA
jgi:hypothetical protein